MSLCEVAGLTKSFGGVAAVADVDLTIETGSIVAVIGPNGAGKTTLINLITGVQTPDTGTVTFDRADVTRLSLDRLAHSGMTRTFQHPRVFRNMTVLDNVMVAARGRPGMLSAGLRWPTAQRGERRARAVAADALRQVGLSCDHAMPAGLLTTGQDKLLELARVLATGPKLVFLDEPAAGLDDHETAELAGRIREINRNGITVVLIEHNMQVVMSLANRVAVMDSGSVIAEGTPDEVRANDAVIEAYLGRSEEFAEIRHD